MNPTEDQADRAELRKADVLDHITRYPLPWRTELLTECGRARIDVAQAIDHPTFRARIKNLGRERTAFTVCMTCASRAGYARPWEIDPVGLLFRELHRVGVYYDRTEPPGSDKSRITAELRALGALVEAHLDEFAGYLDGLDQTVSLDARRAAKRRAAR